MQKGKRKCKYGQWIFSDVNKYPGYDVLLQSCKMLPLRNFSLYYFLQLHVNPQLSQNFSSEKKEADF